MKALYHLHKKEKPIREMSFSLMGFV